MMTMRAMALAAAAGSLGTVAPAMGQAGVDVDLGPLGLGARERLTGTIVGIVGGDIDTYQFGVGGDGPFGVADTSEVVYRFELTETAFIEIEQNAPFTGVADADFVLLNSLNTSLFNGGAGIGIVDNATGALAIQPNGGRFKGIYGPGEYFISVDPFTGVPSTPSLAGGTYDVDLVIVPVAAGVCDNGTGPSVDVNLGTLAAGATRLSGTTAGETNDLCAYADFGGSGEFFGFVSDGAERIYSFTTDDTYRIGISQNQGVLVGARHLHYLLDGLSFTPNFDILADGTLFGSVGGDALGFVDEDSFDGFAQSTLGDGPFGVFGPGTYYLSVDGFDNPAIDGFDGPFDIDLELRTDFRCDDGSGFNVDEDAGRVAGGDRVVLFGIDTSLPQVGAANGVCGYLGLEKGFDFFPGENHPFNEWIVRFELTEPATISIDNFDFGGIDHDHFLLNGGTLLPDFPFINGDIGALATEAIAGVDEAGAFGIFLPGTYFVSVDGRDGNGIIDLDIVFETFGGSALPGVIDPAVECVATGQDLGQRATAFAPFDVSACLATQPDQDTLIAVFDRATGELIAADDDGCGGLGVPSVIEGLSLAEGSYVLSISGASPILRQRNPDGFFPLDATGILGDGLLHDVATCDRAVTGSVEINGTAQAFSAAAFSRDVFCFDVGPFAGDPPVATDLGAVQVGPSSGFFLAIDSCGSSLDTALGVWEADARLIASSNGSQVCPDFNAAVDLDLDPGGTGELDPSFIGRRYYVAVAEMGASIASGFSVSSGGMATGSVAGAVNGVPLSASVGAGEVAWFTFTVAEASEAGCNLADLALPFDQLDIADVVLFLQRFGVQDPTVDFAPPMGQFDIGDVVTFLQVFGSGCPN